MAYSRLLLLVAFRAVFLPDVDRLRMLRIMAGMDPKDCIAFFRISLCKVRFTGDSAPRAVSLPSCCPSQMLGIPAGIDQKDIYAAKWWPRSLLTTEVACLF